jgi:predicted MFS family arabinose efflux permease
MGTFLGGLLLPVLAVMWDWRIAVLAFLALPAAGLLGMLGRSGQRREIRRTGRGWGDVPRIVKWITFYGTVSGLATSATFTFLPLFAEEAEGWTSTQAGWLLAGVGLVGVAARIVWGSLAEGSLGHGRTLRLLAVGAMVSAVLLALAATDVVGSWILIPAAFLFAAGGIAWNAVGMLAVMDFSPAELVGRGTGLVLLGFLLGVGAGAPLMGLSVDRLGAYGPGWVGVGLLFVGCFFVAGKIQAISVETAS